jgi:hypothetical protein
MPWEGIPATGRKSLIKKLKRKYFSNADRIFTENVNAGLAYFEIKKCIKTLGKRMNRRFSHGATGTKVHVYLPYCTQLQFAIISIALRNYQLIRLQQLR